MKITPIEIRQHTFEKSLRGYKVDEVDAFLASLSQEWERVVGDTKMLRMQLELAERELNKLKEIELTLFRTLKNAEDNSAHIAEQANRQAEQYLTETRQKADEQLALAKKKSTVMLQDAETQSRYVRENLSVELKSLEQDFKAMERYKDNLMVQIRALATNAMDSVDRFEKKFAKQSAKQKMDGVLPEEHEQDQPVALLQTPEAEAETPVTESPTDSASQHPATPDLPPDADVPSDTNQPTDYVPEPVATEQEPTAKIEEKVHERDPEPEPAKGGSFFDQI